MGKEIDKLGFGKQIILRSVAKSGYAQNESVLALAADDKNSVPPSFMACVLRENAILQFIKLFGLIKQFVHTNLHIFRIFQNNYTMSITAKQQETAFALIDKIGFFDMLSC